jgi:mono/diheme cytochrome c family protein
MAADVTAKTGVARDRRPTAKPSAARGRELYPDNCAGCHGARGAGDGADAARAGIKPADFTDVPLHAEETPADFFDRVTLGHRRRGMPEWTALTPLQRWDLVAYVWTLQQSDADRAEAKRLWTDRCASCHGAAGGGVEGKAADFTRPGSLIDRTDRALFVVLSRKPHGTANAGPDRRATLAARRSRPRPVARRRLGRAGARGAGAAATLAVGGAPVADGQTALSFHERRNDDGRPAHRGRIAARDHRGTATACPRIHTPTPRRRNNCRPADTCDGAIERLVCSGCSCTPSGSGPYTTSAAGSQQGAALAGSGSE